MIFKMMVKIEVPDFCDYRDYRITGERKRLTEPEKRRLEEIVGGMSAEEQDFIVALLDYRTLTREIERRLHDAKIKIVAAEKIFSKEGGNELF